MIVVGNPAVLMNDKHWLALLLLCKQHGACTGQPMPDLSEAAAAGAAGAQAGSSGSGSSNLQLEVVQLEKLMASITQPGCR